MDKIFKTLNSINGFSKKIIFIASSAVLIACISGICLIAYNSAFVHDVELFEIGSMLIKKSTIVFAQFIIGALIIDWINTTLQNNDD